MTNALYNDGFYTTLSWMQLGVGLTIGLLGVYAMHAFDRLTGRRQPVGAAPRRVKDAGLPMADGPPPTKEKRRPMTNNAMRATYHALGVLAGSRRPLGVGAIVHRIRLAQIARKDNILVTAAAVRNALGRLVAQGNVKMEERGLAITDAGVELFTQIAKQRERSGSSAPEEPSPSSLPSRNGESLAEPKPDRIEHRTDMRPLNGEGMRSRHFFPTDILVPRTLYPADLPKPASGEVRGETEFNAGNAPGAELESIVRDEEDAGLAVEARA